MSEEQEAADLGIALELCHHAAQNAQEAERWLRGVGGARAKKAADVMRFVQAEADYAADKIMRELRARRTA